MSAVRTLGCYKIYDVMIKHVKCIKHNSPCDISTSTNMYKKYPTDSIIFRHVIGNAGIIFGLNVNKCVKNVERLNNQNFLLTENYISLHQTLKDL